MLPHQERVVKEKEELDVKCVALRKFVDESQLYTDLGEDEQFRLEEQLYYMENYSAILGERIAAFN